MNPNDFDLSGIQYWKTAIDLLAKADAFHEATQCLDPDGDFQAWSEAYENWEQAITTAQALFALLRHRGTLDAITENFPMILGRAG
jgi:hypothetical protein